MSDGISVEFEIVEPMIFRGLGEFDPTVRGAYSFALTMQLPSPSTVAGAVASALIARGANVPEYNEDWYAAYKEVLGNVSFKGPFLVFGDDIMLEDRIKRRFLKLEEVVQRCKREYESQESKEEHDQITMSRTGIGLQARSSGSKIASEGFLYTAEFVDYQKLGKAKTSIAVDIFGLDDRLQIINRASIRLGGEGRISLISVSQHARLLRELEERVWKNINDYEGELALYVATPVLIKGGQSVREYLTGWAEKKGIHFSNQEGNQLKGESGIMGAGFSILSRRRKPIYTTDEPGSIIYLKGSFDLKTIYKNWEIGEAAGIGFGTLIPVPLSR